MGSERLVLLALADNANDQGVCWPSIATIARKAGIEERWTQRVIKKLVEAGYIRVTERPGPDGKNATNVYQFLGYEPVKATEKPAEIPVPVAGMGGLQTTHRVAGEPPRDGVQTTQGVVYRPPESSFEPSVNHQNLAAAAGARADAKILLKYHEEIGKVTKAIRMELVGLEFEYSSAWVLAAIEEASLTGGRSLKYIRQILARWKVDGFRVERKPVRSERSGRRGEPSEAEIKKRRALYAGLVIER